MMKVGKFLSCVMLFGGLLVGCDQAEEVVQPDPNDDVHIEVNVPGLDEPIVIDGDVTDEPIVIDIPEIEDDVDMPQLPEVEIDVPENIEVEEPEVEEPEVEEPEVNSVIADVYEYLATVIEYYNYEDTDFNAYFDYYEVDNYVYINIYDEHYTYDDYYNEAVMDPYIVDDTGIQLETVVNDTFAEALRDLGFNGMIEVVFASSDGMNLFWYEIAEGSNHVTYCDSGLPRGGGSNVPEQDVYSDELSDIAINTNGDCSEVVELAEELIPNSVEQQIVDTTDFIEVIAGSNDDFLDEMADEPIDDGMRDYSGITGYGYSNYTVVYSMNDIYTLVHELGHAYDYSFWYYGQNSISETAEWIEAYQTEYISDYGTTCVEEYFAEAFATYLLEPDYVKSVAPYTYELLQYYVGAYAY